MKFTYALGNEFFFGHKLCLAADFAVVPSSVIGRGSDLHRVVFLSCINRAVPAGVIIQARQTSACKVRLKQLFIILKKNSAYTMTLLLNVYFSFTIQWVPDRDFFL